MTNVVGLTDTEVKIDIARLGEAERRELEKLGMLEANRIVPHRPLPEQGERTILPRRQVSAPTVLNEAYDYERPSSFTRALSIDLNGATLLLISGTASVDENGQTVHVGDFRAQCWRTYRNIGTLLEANGMTWHHVIRTTCYLRDIERDYRDFNEIRTAFFGWLGLSPLPASTGIQARLCREDLLVEIEAMAIAHSVDGHGP